jgi:hypothetical protein
VVACLKRLVVVIMDIIWHVMDNGTLCGVHLACDFFSNSIWHTLICGLFNVSCLDNIYSFYFFQFNS